LFLNTKTLYL